MPDCVSVKIESEMRSTVLFIILIYFCIYSIRGNFRLSHNTVSRGDSLVQNFDLNQNKQYKRS